MSVCTDQQSKSRRLMRNITNQISKFRGSLCCGQRLETLRWIAIDRIIQKSIRFTSQVCSTRPFNLWCLPIKQCSQRMDEILAAFPKSSRLLAEQIKKSTITIRWHTLFWMVVQHSVEIQIYSVKQTVHESFELAQATAAQPRLAAVPMRWCPAPEPNPSLLYSSPAQILDPEREYASRLRQIVLNQTAILHEM